MTVEYICNKCGSKKNVKKTVIKGTPYIENEYIDFLFDEDLCVTCRRKLKTIADKFLNNDDVIFVK